MVLRTHVAHPTKTNIVNPDTLDYVRGNDTCIQCHSQGQPLDNPIAGKYYDWPVGFMPGNRLADYWKLEELNRGDQLLSVRGFDGAQESNAGE